MEYLASDKIVIVDLATREILEEELDEDLFLAAEVPIDIRLGHTGSPGA